MLCEKCGNAKKLLLTSWYCDCELIGRSVEETVKFVDLGLLNSNASVVDTKPPNRCINISTAYKVTK